ncbi:hypothetical protein PR048_029057 [Dryococelus australis]|uniref:Uncharacterized protein n=1 Tax=Dryococelus australis TaxID=614101 RepID=A0ABQ9GFU8_9NEOP|nr:hypothetical protein PR048_029057 [Dryococelus australis]
MEPESVLQISEHESLSPPDCSTLKDGSNMDSMMMADLSCQVALGCESSKDGMVVSQTAAKVARVGWMWES